MASRRKKQPAYTPTPPMERTGWRDERDGARYYGKDLRFSVHGHYAMPDKWFVSCPSLQVDAHELVGVKHLDGAKQKGLEYLLRRLSAYGTDLSCAWKALNKEDG